MRLHRSGSAEPFTDRTEAGRRLADRLVDDAGPFVDPIVLALPRGGVPVAVPVAARLSAPLDVLVVRKVGAPGHRELGVGSIAEGGVIVLDDATIAAFGIRRGELDPIVAEERDELDRRVRRYRGDRPAPAMSGRDVVIVDDGLAMGVTARAAVEAARRHAPNRIVVAVPVASADGAAALATARSGVDEPAPVEVVAVLVPDDFRAVGLWYRDFGQVGDAEVLRLLGR